MKPLRRVTMEEFARRLKVTTEEIDKRFAFFLGAGASVSSGIPEASDLVKLDWLPRLRDVSSPQRKDLDIWAKEEFPDYNPQNPSIIYGALMEKLFLYPEERQREIERQCDGKFPSFGYAVLASLMVLEGGRFNVALTTNFDDLIADALYLFPQSRPLVIHHESLASYIRPTRTRPLVVKLHGDYRLSPQNTVLETETLKESIEKQVRTLLHDRGLIFIGYGGNDKGIEKMLEALSNEALPLGVFWVSPKQPGDVIRPWLELRDAVWVEKGDFDELMLLVRDVFNLPHPDRRRFEEIFTKYNETYDILSRRIISLSDATPNVPVLKEAVKRTDESFPDEWAVITMARRQEKTDPEQAQTIYLKGLKQFPRSFSLLSQYAIFLIHIRKDSDKAEEYFQRALAAEPNHPVTLGNYANFLWTIRKDYDKAEEHYRRALAADPKRTFFLGNYAGFLLANGRRPEGLEILEKVLHSPDLSQNPTLEVECWFYALAHRSVEGQDEALQNLKRALIAGARSPGWNLIPNIQQAKNVGNPDVPWLEKLAAIISEGAEIGILDEWSKWKKT